MSTANHLDFLEVLDRYTRTRPSGAVTTGYEMHVIAGQAGLVAHGDLSAARWTGELVDLGYVKPGPRMRGDTRPIPSGLGWTDRELQSYSDYRVMPEGRQEADRIRRLGREAATDVALGRALPSLVRPWLADAQRAALAGPLRDLEAALTDERAPAAIGAAKELVEAACKVVLERRGVTAEKTASLPKLFTAARRALGVADGEVGRSLAATVQKLHDLRNTVGTGHGRAAAPEVDSGQARLAATAATGLTEFLLGAVSL